VNSTLKGETIPCLKQAHSSRALARSLGRNWRRCQLPRQQAHIPIPHAAIVEALVDTLCKRQISIVDEEFAGSKGGMEMFVVLDLAAGFEGCVSQSESGIRTTSDFGWHAPSGYGTAWISGL
jgi:hypothetical protein